MIETISPAVCGTRHRTALALALFAAGAIGVAATRRPGARRVRLARRSSRSRSSWPLAACCARPACCGSRCRSRAARFPSAGPRAAAAGVVVRLRRRPRGRRAHLPAGRDLPGRGRRRGASGTRRRARAGRRFGIGRASVAAVRLPPPSCERMRAALPADARASTPCALAALALALVSHRPARADVSRSARQPARPGRLRGRRARLHPAGRRRPTEVRGAGGPARPSRSPGRPGRRCAATTSPTAIPAASRWSSGGPARP